VDARAEQPVVEEKAPVKAKSKAKKTASKK
jgi:hypothetical protein